MRVLVSKCMAHDGLVMRYGPCLQTSKRVFRRYATASRRTPVSNSREAQKQLTMGWQLDAEHKEAPPVPILETIFDDKDLYTRPSDAMASYRRPFVNPTTEFVTAPGTIKGANALFIQALFQGHRLLRQCKARLEMPNFLTLLYFPPWHPLAAGRKSRPALCVVPMQGAPYNGNTPTLRPKANVARLSRNPIDFAVWRQRAGKRLRRALFESLQSTDGFRDGLYISIVKRVPTQEQARKAVSKFVADVAASNHEWADKQQNSVNLAVINKRLVAAKCASVCPTKRADWELQMQDR